MTRARLPAGWVGKNHAVSIGAAAAQGDWLLFTDADTYHYPGATRRALGDAVDHDAVLVSYSPEQEMETWWERALIPFVYCRLAAKFSFARVNDPKRPDAAANGQFLLVLRDAYDAVGGHAAVAREILEDVALARLREAERLRDLFHGADGRGAHADVSVVRGNVAGLDEEPLPADGRERQVDVFRTHGHASHFRGGTVDRRAAALCRREDFVIGGGCGRVYRRAAGAGIWPMRRRCTGISIRTSYIQYYVVGSALYSAALIGSWWKSTRGKVVWKGREYAAKTP